jgi:hypothetical protein
MSPALTEPLYVIVPYFNFVNYQTGGDNLSIFLDNIDLHRGARVVIVEGYQDTASQLPDFSDRVFKHIKVPVRDALWVKENLINIGFQQLPPTWEYGAWVDRDIVFCNPHWVDETIEQLQRCDMVQPWKECCYLNDLYEHDPLEFGEWQVAKKELAYSFCSIEVAKRKDPSAPPAGFSHPGQAWAIRRDFFEKIGGLYDLSILGNGDGIVMYGILGRIDHPAIQLLGKTAVAFARLLSDCRIGYSSGLILHYFHGPLAKRGYMSRLDIYRKHKFDPITFLYRDENNVLCLTEKGSVMALEARNYFSSREEDVRPSSPSVDKERPDGEYPWALVWKAIKHLARYLRK